MGGACLNASAQERGVGGPPEFGAALSIDSRLARITQSDPVSPNNTKQKYLLGRHGGLVYKNVYCASARRT